MLRELFVGLLLVLVDAHDPCIGHHCHETDTSGVTIAVGVVLMLVIIGVVLSFPWSSTEYDRGIHSDRQILAARQVQQQQQQAQQAQQVQLLTWAAMQEQRKKPEAKILAEVGDYKTEKGKILIFIDNEEDYNMIRKDDGQVGWYVKKHGGEYWCQVAAKFQDNEGKQFTGNDGRFGLEGVNSTSGIKGSQADAILEKANKIAGRS